MQLLFRRLASVLFLVSFPLFAADAPWNDAPPLTADPKAVLAAAERIPAGESDVVILLDEGSYVFDAAGQVTQTQRFLYRIVAESAIEYWSTMQAPWAPWYTERPVIQARVITKDGAVQMLDAKAITEAPAPEESLDIFSDARVIRAPLPAIAVGSIVEQVVTWKQKNIFDAGMADSFYFGGYVPVQKARIVIDAPASLAIRIENRTSPRIEPQKTEKDGRQHIVIEGGPFTPLEDVEWNLPYDVSPLPYVAFSTGKSWQDIATRYSEIVEKQIAGSSLGKLTKEAVGNATDRKEIVARVLAAIQKRVRYAGVEVGEGSIVPRVPTEVLQHQYGDCKDKATLLVAMLREVGIKANVALLRAGTDQDVPADLPGLGHFNHAIVVVHGDTPLWVDPTDEFARAGELPSMDQGRLALIADPSTTAMVTTPTYESTANRTVETRTFTLVEEGKAALVETTEMSGADESAQRRYYVSTEKKDYRESMERYVKGYYLAKSLKKIDASDPHDLTKPFRVDLHIDEAGRGVTEDGEAVAVVFPSGLLDGLPWQLRDYEPGEEKAEDGGKPKHIRRVHDFVFHSPFVKEWRYRVVPPPGYVLRALPEKETVKLSTMTMTKEYTSEPGGVLLATYRLDSGKRRISASEFEEMRKAIYDLEQKPGIILGFDSQGQLAINNGKIGDAIAFFRKLAEMHPKEGRHQVEIAQALLAGGMGEAAREQVKRAIALEPKYAGAYRAQGLILQHDLLGRPLRKGADLKAAIAAYRKAKELDPKNAAIRAELAKLLEYDEEGALFGPTARVGEAIDEFRAIAKDLDDKDYEGELVPALAYAGRFDELRALASETEDKTRADVARILAAGATAGSKAALHEAGSLDPAARKERLRAAAGFLMAMRRYDVAADLLEEVAPGMPNAAEMRGYAAVLRKTRRVDPNELPVGDPKSFALRFMFAVGLRDLDDKEFAAYFPAGYGVLFDDSAARSQRNAARIMVTNVARQQGFPVAFYLDIGMAAIQMTLDGDDATGYRLRVRGTGKQADDETMFIVKEPDGYRVGGSSKLPASVGLTALRLLDAGKPEAARQWLNWIREEVSAGSGDDELSGSPFARVWTKAKQSATADEIRLGAALLMLHKELSDKSLPILQKARETASDDVKMRIDQALLALHFASKRFDEALPIAQRLYAAHPDSTSAFETVNGVLTQLANRAEIEKLAKERLERMPDDRDAVRALGHAAMVDGDYETSERYYRQIVDKLNPTAGDYNNLIWNAILANRGLERAAEDARQATTLGGGYALQHTVASLYAETGKNLEAREAMLSAMDSIGRDEPGSEDWYVLGRIAENYGVTDAALAAYGKVKKPETAASAKTSTYMLAQRRIAALRVQK